MSAAEAFHNRPAALPTPPRPFDPRLPTLVVGLGRTGVSAARFLAALGTPLSLVDSRADPPTAAELRYLLPDAPASFGPFDETAFRGAAQIVLSPGISPHTPAVAAAAREGVPVFGDIELFAQYARAPVVAITGSNGKSTVTVLLGEMARQAGLDVRVGGNVGVPALELLDGDTPEFYVLELSSFQLETTGSLEPTAATVLNVSPDHMDRHAGMNDYAAIKQRVYAGDGVQVINADDPRVLAMTESGRKIRRFGVDSRDCDYSLVEYGGESWLACDGAALMKASELRMAGRQNLANALAALALGEAIGLPRKAMADALRSFPGLPHRCQLVRERRGVRWYDDSKGTNVGATVAALEGIPGEGVVLIAGGDGKGADFSPLRHPVARRCRAVVLIGRDRPLIEAAVREAVPVEQAEDMEEAVVVAAGLALPGDSVLLSPACASFDMFADYMARGRAFTAAVEALRE